MDSLKQFLIGAGYVGGYFVLPFIIGRVLGKALRVKDYSFKIGLILCTIGLGCAPFVNQVIHGHSPMDALAWGIDLAGGTNLIYQVEQQPDEPLTDDLMNRMVGAVSKRINPAGTKEVTVRRVGRDRIEVIIPGADRDMVEETKDLMTKLGNLEFSIVANNRDHAAWIAQAKLTPGDVVRVEGEPVAIWRDVRPTVLPDGSLEPNPEFDNDPEVAVRQSPGKPEGFHQVLILMPPEGQQITGKYLRRAHATNDTNGRPAVGFNFNQEGANLFSDLTSRNRPRKDGSKRRLAILLDNQVVTAPTLNSTIGASGIIEGRFTMKEVEDTVAVLNAGSLPAPLKKDPISEYTISPTLGSDVQTKGIRSLWVSTLAVVVFMGGYYLIAGAIADFALMLNLLFIVSVMAFIKAAFTLPGLAGLVLSAGMAVDANVLIYERIREELQRGASLRMAIHNGFDRALTAIIDSNLTTLITAVILYMIGTDQVKGFAVSLFIGLVMNLYTAIYVSRAILDILEKTKAIKTLKMFSMIGETKIDFVGKQFVATVASLILIVIGLSAVAIRGENNLDIDFTGGTMVTMQFTSSQQTDDVRNKLEEKIGKNITLEALSRANQSADTKGVLFRLRTTDQDEAHVKTVINDTFPGQLMRVTMTPGELKLIPETKPSDTADNIDAVYEGGHEVELSFSSQIAPTTVSKYIETELKSREHLKPLTLFTLTGIVDEGKKPQEAGTVKLFDKMQLKFVQDVPEKEAAEVVAVVENTMANSPNFEEVTSFESSVANDAIASAIIAVIASLLAIIIYVWFRFERIVFGVSAVIALIHDVLVTLGCVALASYLSNTTIGSILLFTDFRINMSMVAAFLTIIGYSINDTIVIFDRLREIRGKNPDVTKDMINLTVNQTLSRTLLTALTVFLSVTILYAIGGEGIHGFAFCMVIGSIAGTYSTVYIASPLVLWFMERLKASENRTNRSNQRPTAVARS